MQSPAKISSVDIEMQTTILFKDAKTELPSINSMECAIAISPRALAKLLESGVLSASEIRPLNDATKLQIKHQCLKGCQGKSCEQCLFRNRCEFKPSESECV